MLEDPHYRPDSAYTLSLEAPDRPTAASELSIRVDDGADVVIELVGRAREHLSAYMTMDQAEELHAALAEILRFPSDQTDAIKVSGRIRNDQGGDSGAVPRR